MQQTVLTVNLKTKFQALQDLLAASLIFISASLMMHFYFDYTLIFFCLFGFYFLFFFLPVIILHNNYEKYNEKKELIFKENKLIFDSKEIKIDEITKAKIVGTNQSINKYSYAKSAYETAYFYIEISLKNGEKIYLTNLLSKNLKEIFEQNYPSVKLEKDITIYPLIKNDG